MSAILTPETTVPAQRSALDGCESNLLHIEEQARNAASMALGLHCAIVIETAKAELGEPTEQCHLIGRLHCAQEFIVQLCSDTSPDIQ